MAWRPRSWSRDRGGGGRAIAVAADVANVASVEAMVARTEAKLGRVTILVNNAGVAWRGTYDQERVARMRFIPRAR
jgi:NAD(P)-dependent dehydrogenase (short-subunit alcohol dehydrogenase family)